MKSVRASRIEAMDVRSANLTAFPNGDILGECGEAASLPNVMIDAAPTCGLCKGPTVFFQERGIVSIEEGVSADEKARKRDVRTTPSPGAGH